MNDDEVVRLLMKLTEGMAEATTAIAKLHAKHSEVLKEIVEIRQDAQRAFLTLVAHEYLIGATIAQLVRLTNNPSQTRRMVLQEARTFMSEAANDPRLQDATTTAAHDIMARLTQQVDLAIGQADLAKERGTGAPHRAKRWLRREQ